MNGRILTITGRAGTGKTTALIALYRAYSEQGKRVIRAEPSVGPATIRRWIADLRSEVILIDHPGPELLRALQAIAEEYPDTLFVVTQDASPC